MAKAKTTKTSTKDTAKASGIECVNNVTISGKIQKVLIQSDKCAIFTLDSTRKTPKGNFTHTWVTVCEFEPLTEYEENHLVEVAGYLSTDSYEKNGSKVYQLRVIADEVNVLDEIPF